MAQRRLPKSLNDLDTPTRRPFLEHSRSGTASVPAISGRKGINPTNECLRHAALCRFARRWGAGTIFTIRMAGTRSVRLAAAPTDGRFSGCSAAGFASQPRPPICCDRMVGNLDPSAVGSKPTSEAFCQMSGLRGLANISVRETAISGGNVRFR